MVIARLVKENDMKVNYDKTVVLIADLMEKVAVDSGLNTDSEVEFTEEMVLSVAVNLLEALDVIKK